MHPQTLMIGELKTKITKLEQNKSNISSLQFMVNPLNLS